MHVGMTYVSEGNCSHCVFSSLKTTDLETYKAAGTVFNGLWICLFL